ncbi:MAG: non-heme iron oxygenase ferredoxin subunit [bacterium]|nr:non-heme iron oxygenase ferredoxin subunit [bacterium]
MTNRISLGKVTELPAGSGVRVEHGDHRVAVFRVGDSIYAIGDRCSHAEASLADGELFDLAVECPRHGSEFDLETGQPGSFPATRSVPVYEVVIEQDEAFLLIADDGEAAE